jgi:hypothetical protein
MTARMSPQPTGPFARLVRPGVFRPSYRYMLCLAMVAEVALVAVSLWAAATAFG